MTTPPTRTLEVDGVAIEVREHCWIPMADGVRLSAATWRPAGGEPLPAVLEIIPYRKRDHTAARDAWLHSALAARRYATVRVDMRGHGDSEGLHDAQRTYEDCVEILAWMRAQPWCSGQLAMVGLSWGGTNAFMAAHRQPPGLAAIATASSSHDRYAIGMLWKNGCLLNENFAWVTSITAFATRPPDPKVVGEGWRALWQRRLDAHVTEARNMLARQRRDAYWDAHLADPARFRAAAMLWSGLADINYAQTPPQLQPKLAVPNTIVLGPWGHKYPHQAYPGPGVDFPAMIADWFDAHLRGGRAPAPAPLNIFMAEDLPSRANYPTAPGRWLALPGLPDAATPVRRFHLDDARLADDPAAGGVATHCAPLDTGTASGEVMPWFAYGPGPELPDDQRGDDGRSLCFDSAPLEADLEFVGRPELRLAFSVDRPVAFVAARLCDVKPDGASSRVSLGLFNLCNHLGDERTPRRLEPGKRYELALPLDFSAYRWRAGHRVRLALSTSYWPLVWPSPEPVTLSVHLAGSELRLPLLDRARELPAPAFPPPRPGATVARTEARPASRSRTVHRDVESRTTTVEIREANGPYTLTDLDWTVRSDCVERYTVVQDDPLSAHVTIAWEWDYGRGPWLAQTRVRSEMRSSAAAFHIRLWAEALENGTAFFQREWTYDIPRDGN